MMKNLILFLCLLVFPMAAFGQTMTVKLYFDNEKFDPNGCDGKVFAVTRRIPKTKAVAKATLEELFKGVTKDEEAKGYRSFFSDETKDLIISVKVKNSIAYVNFKGEIVQKLGNATSSCGSVSYEASVLNTLKQFPTIKKVMFAIERDPALYYDWMQIGECPKELKGCSNKNF